MPTMQSIKLLVGLTLAAAALAAAGQTPCGELPPRWRTDLLLALNRVRAEGVPCGAESLRRDPAPALRWHAGLETMSQRQAAWVALSGEAQHLGPAGESLAQRALAAGYSHTAIAENVALGLPTAEVAVQAWQGSAAHCKNMMDRRLRDAGAACVQSAAGPAWVLTLAASRAVQPPTPMPTQ